MGPQVFLRPFSACSLFRNISRLCMWPISLFRDTCYIKNMHIFSYLSFCFRTPRVTVVHRGVTGVCRWFLWRWGILLVRSLLYLLKTCWAEAGFLKDERTAAAFSRCQNSPATICPISSAVIRSFIVHVQSYIKASLFLSLPKCTIYISLGWSLPSLLHAVPTSIPHSFDIARIFLSLLTFTFPIILLIPPVLIYTEP